MRLTYRLCFTRREPLSKTPGDSTWEGCHWGSQTRMLYETPTQSEHWGWRAELHIDNASPGCRVSARAQLSQGSWPRPSRASPRAPEQEFCVVLTCHEVIFLWWFSDHLMKSTLSSKAPQSRWCLASGLRLASPCCSLGRWRSFRKHLGAFSSGGEGNEP